MSTEENKALAQRVIEEIFSQGDMSRIDELLAPDMVVDDPDKELHGKAQIEQGIARLREAFPDLHYSIEDLIAEGDKVAIRYRGQGTHLGDFRGVPPTKKG